MKFKRSEIIYILSGFIKIKKKWFSKFGENKGFAMFKKGIDAILSNTRVHNKGNNILGKSIFGAAKSLNT